MAPKAPKPIPQSASAASNPGGWDNDCCCDDCCDGHCGHDHYCRQLRNLKRQMPQHYPYEAQPWTYYYFRPYNYRHIGYQQRDAQGWGADTRQPYARHLFDKLYVDLEPQMSAGADASSKK